MLDPLTFVEEEIEAHNRKVISSGSPMQSLPELETDWMSFVLLTGAESAQEFSL